MKNFAKQSESWANELWNVSLWPVAGAADVANQNELTLTALENVDERRSVEAFLRPLRVSCERSSVILG
jgi:hypothetical protein